MVGILQNATLQIMMKMKDNMEENESAASNYVFQCSQW